MASLRTRQPPLTHMRAHGGQASLSPRSAAPAGACVCVCGSPGIRQRQNTVWDACRDHPVRVETSEGRTGIKAGLAGAASISSCLPCMAIPAGLACSACPGGLKLQLSSHLGLRACAICKAGMTRALVCVQLTARVQGTLKLTGEDEEAKKKVYPGGGSCPRVEGFSRLCGVIGDSHAPCLRQAAVHT